jgi:hypothetical protein
MADATPAANENDFIPPPSEPNPSSNDVPGLRESEPNPAMVALKGFGDFLRSAGLQSLPSQENAMAEIGREELAANFRAAAAETDTKIVRMEGKIDLLANTISGKLDAVSTEIGRAQQDAKDTKWILFGTILASALALMGLIIGLATYGDALFSRGMDVHKVIEETINAQKATTKP